MTIIRTKRSRNFTTIPNDLINDSALYWQDLGMVVYLLSKPDSWFIKPDILAKERNLRRDGVYEILKRLRDAGYADLVRFPNGKTEWTIYDQPYPEKADKDVNPHPENPDRENPYRENPDRENPYRENPDRENPDVLVNTDIAVKTNNKKILKHQQKRDCALDDSLFDTFWSFYPRKVGKQEARKSFDKLNTNPEEVQSILFALSWQKQTDQWQRGVIPNPKTYLNQKRWLDEKPPDNVIFKRRADDFKNKKFSGFDYINGGDGYGNKRNEQQEFIEGELVRSYPAIQGQKAD